MNSPTVWYFSFFGCLERVRHYTDMDERRNLVYFTVWSSWLLSPMHHVLWLATGNRHTLYVKGNSPLLSLGGCRRSGRGKGHTCHMLAMFSAHPNRWSDSTSPNTHYPACYSSEHGNTICSRTEYCVVGMQRYLFQNRSDTIAVFF